MMECPHCGGEIAAMDIGFNFSKGTVESGRYGVTLGPLQMHILEHLIDAYPRGIALAELAAAVYPDNDDAMASLRATILIIRRKFAAANMPWSIGIVSTGNGNDSAVTLIHEQLRQPAKRSA